MAKVNTTVPALHFFFSICVSFLDSPLPLTASLPFPLIRLKVFPTFRRVKMSEFLSFFLKENSFKMFQTVRIVYLYIEVWIKRFSFKKYHKMDVAGHSLCWYCPSEFLLGVQYKLDSLHSFELLEQKRFLFLIFIASIWINGKWKKLKIKKMGHVFIKGSNLTVKYSHINV